MSRGRKGKRRREKRALVRRRWKRIAALIGGAAAVAIVVACAFFIIPHGGGQSEASAVIVDQLSLTSPNSGFIEAATETLEQAGYRVDYYPGEEVTVELYRRLPAYDYDVVILRVHSARFRESDGALTDDVVLFTGEAYSRARYGEERKAGVLARANYFRTDPPSYFFGIEAGFVESRMKGRFDEATVILMGCDGVRSSTMGEAFHRRGAGAFIGWDGPVSASHTDAATGRLLRYLLVDGLTTEEAVTRTLAEVGADPVYGATLLVHSSEG